MPEIIKSKHQYFIVRAAMIVCIALHTVASFAQFGRSGYTKRADALFNKQNYYGAAQFYKSALTGKYEFTASVLPYLPVRHKNGRKARGKNGVYLTYQLAESYRLYHNYREALPLYQHYFKLTTQPLPLARLWYGICLRANDEAEEAINQLTQFNTNYTHNNTYKKQALLELANCYFSIDRKKNPQKFTITKPGQRINADGSNYALEKLNDSLFVFSSSRTDTTHQKEVVHPSRLFSTNLQTDSLFKVNFPNHSLDIAASHLSSDGLTLYFTGWKETYTTSQNRYSIYYSKRQNPESGWGSPVLMDTLVNAPGFNAKQPFVTTDNKFLLFASDRPGGFGNYDLWMIRLSDGNPVGTAINLGDSINTSGEEAAPFYNEITKQLYFSSDGRIGMGGMDMYKDSGDVATNSWASPVNLGYPLNSVKNDLYYKKYNDSDTSYFSSDRESPCCLEIFQAIKEKNIDTSTITSPKTDTSLNKTVPLIDTINNKEAANKTYTPTDEEINRQRLLDSLNQSTVKRFSVNFDFDKAIIRKHDATTLDTVIQLLKDNPELNVVVASFTDCKGSNEVNLRLSKARSGAVRAYLKKHHIKPTRINIDFYGEQHLILPCKDDSTYDTIQQAANRRSDIILTKEKTPKWRPSGKELDINEILDDIRNGRRPFHFTEEPPTKKESRRERRKRVQAEKERAREDKIRMGKEISTDEKDITGKPDNPYLSEIERNRATGKKKKIKKVKRPPDNNPYLAEAGKKAVINQPYKPNRGADDDALNEANKNKLIATLDSISDIKNRLLVAEMSNRATSKIVNVYTSSDSVHIELYDNGVFDNDSISVIYNRKLVVYKKVLQVNSPISFYVKVDPEEKKNEMIFYAENLGVIPPNSALMVITDGEGKRTEVSVTNDLQHNTIIYFVKLKKK